MGLLTLACPSAVAKTNVSKIAIKGGKSVWEKHEDAYISHFTTHRQCIEEQMLYSRFSFSETSERSNC